MELWKHTSPTRSTAAAAAALTLMLYGLPAYAQEQPPATDPDAVTIQHPTPAPVGIVQSDAWTVTPFISSGFAGGLEGGAFNVGFAGAYNVSSRVSFEGEFGIMPGAEQGAITPFESTVTTISANALYHFAVQDVAPYVTLGIGMARASTSDDPVFGDQSSNVFAVNFGGGVKARLTDFTVLRADLRYFNGRELVPDFWRVYGGLTFTVAPR